MIRKMFTVKATMGTVTITRRGLRFLANSCYTTNIKSIELKAPTASTTIARYAHNLSTVEKFPAERVKPVNKYSLRTHTCGELRIDNVGEEVKLHGWLEFSRLGQFLTLRDAYGSTQVLIPKDREDLQRLVQSTPFESVLEVTGTVIPRPEDMKNKKMKTGDIEVRINRLEVLNKAQKNIPILIRGFHKVTEVQQLKYRYLFLRHKQMQSVLRMRSSMVAKMREFLIKECNFVDIDTPTLFKSTPGGAQEFIVPTRHPDQFYTLVQSPQQFKQLLMVGGFDRYFQVARCYRDEGARPDRQPEFTQLDIEMSFVDEKGIMQLTEDLLAYCWPEELGTLATPFERMTYSSAMELYGTDKPDLRIPYQLQNLTGTIDRAVVEETFNLDRSEERRVYAVVFPNKSSCLTKSAREKIAETQAMYYPNVKLVQLKYNENTPETRLDRLHSVLTRDKQKLGLNNGDLLFLAVGNERETQELLGRILVQFTDLLEGKGERIRSSGDRLLWITDFPLFSLNEQNLLESSHHPFTQPHPDDLHHLSTSPEKVRGLHYDLVMNGSEIAGGSIRIFDKGLQERILDVLRIEKTHLSHMLEALENGAPPHGGIALGLDRLICLLCRMQSIKNVIAFPKTIEGRDLMSGAPGPVSDRDKQIYHVRSTNE